MMAFGTLCNHMPSCLGSWIFPGLHMVCFPWQSSGWLFRLCFWVAMVFVPFGGVQKTAKPFQGLTRRSQSFARSAVGSEAVEPRSQHNQSIQDSLFCKFHDYLIK